MEKDKLYCEMSTFTFRKSELTVPYLFYRDEHGEEYTTTETDTISLELAQNAYREKFSIPFPDEIRSIRKKYGLSAIKMSKLLGFGDNQYRLYENGELPSLSNAKIISGVEDIHFFERLVNESVELFSDIDKERITKRIEDLRRLNTDKRKYDELVFRNHPIQKSHLNGYVSLNINKLRNMVVFFASKLNGVFETKMNKLLFYSDFLHYKHYAKGISGLRYQAITFGPVPVNYGTIYESLVEGVHKELKEVSGGYVGSVINTDTDFDPLLFTEAELQAMQTVLNQFGDLSATRISDESHKEQAWIDNKDKHAIIDYSYAFQLSI